MTMLQIQQLWESVTLFLWQAVVGAASIQLDPASASSEPFRESDDVPGVLEGAELVGHGDGDVAMDVRAARGEAEALVEDRPELDEPFSVVEFPLASIRDVCIPLVLGRRSGGKMKCLERQQLVAQHSAEIQLRKDDVY